MHKTKTTQTIFAVSSSLKRPHKPTISIQHLKKEVIMAMKKGTWDTILKVIIAVASAILGALGGNAM